MTIWPIIGTPFGQMRNVVDAMNSAFKEEGREVDLWGFDSLHFNLAKRSGDGEPKPVFEVFGRRWLI